MKNLKNFPFHTLLFAIFPTISLMGHNIGQISLIYIARPLVVSVILTILLLLLIFVFIKDWTKAGSDRDTHDHSLFHVWDSVRPDPG